MPGYSNGYRSGVLVKAAKKGIVFRSYEGQLRVSQFGLNNQRGRDVGNLWEFSTRDEEIGQRLELFVGKPVKIHYHQFWLRPITQDTDFTIDGIEEARQMAYAESGIRGAPRTAFTAPPRHDCSAPACHAESVGSGINGSPRGLSVALRFDVGAFRFGVGAGRAGGNQANRLAFPTRSHIPPSTSWR
jgi:hypothetical protein